MSGEVEAVVLVWLNHTQDAPCLEAYLARRPEVVDAWWVAADSDAVVRVRCRDMAALDGLVRGLRHHAGAGRTSTHLVLRPFDPHLTRSRPMSERSERSQLSPVGSCSADRREVAA